MADKKPSEYKAKSDAPAKRDALRKDRDAYRVRNMKVPRGATRAKRRAMGDLAPVNPEASLAQHPMGRYARGLHKPVKATAAVAE